MFDNFVAELLLSHVMPPDSPGFKRVLEMGNRCEGVRSTMGSFATSSEFFTALRVDQHVRLACDSDPGVVHADLSSPIRIPEFDDYFDIVINPAEIACIDPIDGQFEFLRTMHACCCQGGFMVHVLPVPESYVAFGHYTYEMDFAAVLAQTNDYEVLWRDVVEHATMGASSQRRKHVVFRKRHDVPFKSERKSIVSLITNITGLPCDE